MAKEIFMPKLSSTMEVGTLLQWFKDEGDTVEIGEPLFEIMTDKINIEVESYEEGVLLKKYYQEDDEVAVNTIIGYIGAEDEQAPESTSLIEETSSIVTEEQHILENEEPIVTTEKIRATPAARRIARESNLQLENITGSGPSGRIQKADVTAMVAVQSKRKMTPLAKKIADTTGVNMNEIDGTGLQGKVHKVDVLEHLHHHHDNEKVKTSDKSNTATPKAKQKLSGLRKAIATKMQTSIQTIPHVTLTSEIDMTEVIKLRAQLLPVIEQETGHRLSYTEIIMKATAKALKKHPQVNASLIDEEIIFNESINIGLAVAVDNGLIVPTVHHVDEKGLGDLTVLCKSLGEKARQQQLQPADLSGSTFTISNLGMYAIDGFTPIINPPEVGILGVGQITKKPVVINDQIDIRSILVLSLSFDHRVIDGAPAAHFLTDLKMILENPYRLLV